MEVRTTSVEETQDLGEKFAQRLKGQEIIALYGGLGAGKTHFTQGICDGLNVREDVSSPTFSIVNEYSGKYKVFHFDMYRIKTLEDLCSIGFFDYIGNGVLIIEWSENIESILPEESIKIQIEPTDVENERIITFKGENFFENLSY